MNFTSANIAESYAYYKQAWDSLPENVRQIVDDALPPAPTNDKTFNAAFTLGFNDAIDKVLGLLTYSSKTDPTNKEIQITKDIVSWVAIRLFLVQYELSLLESPSMGTLH